MHGTRYNCHSVILRFWSITKALVQCSVNIIYIERLISTSSFVMISYFRGQVVHKWHGVFNHMLNTPFSWNWCFASFSIFLFNAIFKKFDGNNRLTIYTYTMMCCFNDRIFDGFAMIVYNYSFSNFTENTSIIRFMIKSGSTVMIHQHWSIIQRLAWKWLRTVT